MAPIQTEVFSRVLKYEDPIKSATSKVVNAIYLFTQNLFAGFCEPHRHTFHKHKVNQGCIVQTRYGKLEISCLASKIKEFLVNTVLQMKCFEVPVRIKM